MRVNIYAEEMTDRVEIISKEIDSEVFTGVRFYLYLPVTIPNSDKSMGPTKLSDLKVRGPFIHREGDDDSSAVTFWGKKDLKKILQKALELLENYKK